MEGRKEGTEGGREGGRKEGRGKKGAKKERKKEKLLTKGKVKVVAEMITVNYLVKDFPGGSVVKNPPANAGDTGSIPAQGRSHMLQSS